MSQALIDVQDLTREFVTGDVVTRVLKDIDLTIEEGDFVAIMGPSGSGKSTLMHILSFLDTPTSGTYLFRGDDVSRLTSDELAAMRGERVGFVFQSFNLLPKSTVYENVELPLVYARNSTSKDQVEDAIRAVGLEHRMHHTCNNLSGGEKQRVAIARAVVRKPDVIFADEPTGNLDSKSGTQILRILQDLNEAGRTVVMVTHEQDTADHAKRIVHVRDGVIEKQTPVAVRRFAKDQSLSK